MSERESIYAHRRNHIAEACKRLNIMQEELKKFTKRKTPGVITPLLTDQQHSYAYCQIPKVKMNGIHLTFAR